MSLKPISVFYGSGGMFQLRTDFETVEKAKAFITSRLFIFDGFRFDFMLKNGNELIKGNPKNSSPKYFKDSMRFAIEVPVEDYKELSD